jgi:hypothetical protein
MKFESGNAGHLDSLKEEGGCKRLNEEAMKKEKNGEKRQKNGRKENKVGTKPGAKQFRSNQFLT